MIYLVNISAYNSTLVSVFEEKTERQAAKRYRIV